MHYLPAREHIDEVIKVLEEEYGSPHHGNLNDPLDELIYIKLSLRTNAPKFNRVYENLQNRYPAWHGLESASREELEEILRPCGLHRKRARDLQGMVARIVEDRGYLDLSWLRELPVSEVIKYLASLPGVGPKTAYCVAMYSLEQDVAPVDVHVGRVSERLGLLASGLNSKQKHNVLAEVLPPGKAYSYHVNCVSHGRAICRKLPKCHICPISQYCAFYNLGTDAESSQGGGPDW